MCPFKYRNTMSNPHWSLEEGLSRSSEHYAPLAAVSFSCLVCEGSWRVIHSYWFQWDWNASWALNIKIAKLSQVKEDGGWSGVGLAEEPYPLSSRNQYLSDMSMPTYNAFLNIFSRIPPNVDRHLIAIKLERYLIYICALALVQSHLSVIYHFRLRRDRL